MIVFALGAAAIIGMFFEGTRHETSIVGTWKEVKWIYEGEESFDAYDVRAEAADQLNKKIGHDFFIHENETWIFSDNGELVTSSSNNGKEMSLRWVIKGRGNILVLKDGSEPVEAYNITRLDDNKMVLNFDVDLKAKGVAELTFERIIQQ